MNKLTKRQELENNTDAQQEKSTYLNCESKRFNVG